ncbi:hypothetical protein TREES_T100007758 [Tupaia chinensis]|uniref:Uncharacterized protein n=1 Tax=Tupaia chinensis TaxID=246437 RepID=L9KME8_TUPCH|nr:hypothetical protein TREES_T100007758 [Tupaia chinensis]
MRAKSEGPGLLQRVSALPATYGFEQGAGPKTGSRPGRAAECVISAGSCFLGSIIRAHQGEMKIMRSGGFWFKNYSVGAHLFQPPHVTVILLLLLLLCPLGIPPPPCMVKMRAESSGTFSSY